MHVVLIVCAAAVGSDGEGERLDDGAPEWESMEQEQRTVVYCSIQCVPWASGLIVHVAFSAHLTFELVAVTNLSCRAFAFASPRYWQLAWSHPANAGNGVAGLCCERGCHPARRLHACAGFAA